MDKDEIIQKIRIAEEISNASKKFPESTYKVVLTLLLSNNINTLKDVNASSNDSKKFIKRKRNNKSDNKGKVKKTNKGLSQVINKLIDDRFFQELKTSKEILAKLKLLGFQMKTTSLPSYLLPKIRNGELFREEVATKNGKIYGYIRKAK